MMGANVPPTTNYPPPGAPPIAPAPRPVAPGQLGAGLGRTRAAVADWLKQQQPRAYWKVLLGGIVAWAIANAIASGTGNAPLLALDFVVGAGLVPLCFVLFWTEEITEATVPGNILALACAGGGTIGLMSGILAENALNPAANWGGDLLVGLAEEAAKGLVILLILRYATAHLPHRLHGLLVGVAVGAGFAAVETLGYGMGQFISDIQIPQVSFGAALADANATLISRMILSPYGHVAWAGILGAAIWRERRGGAFALTPGVMQAFALVVILHGLFDGSLDAGWPSIPIGSFSLPLFDTFIVGPFGLITLCFFVYEARERNTPATPGPLAAALREYYHCLGVFAGLLPDPSMRPAMAASVPPIPGPRATSTPPAALARYCTQCGAPSVAGARFCSRCGAAITPPSASS